MDIKKFIKNHKKEIIIGTVVTISVVGLIVKIKHGKRLKLVNLRGLNAITWDANQPETFMTLERVKELLDLNANNDSMFAIFKEFAEADKYVCLILNDSVALV